MAAGDTSRGGGSPQEPNGVSNLLVCAGSMDEEARRRYYEQLLPGPASSLRVLAVTYTHGPDAWLDEWRRYADALPAECALISVTDGMRSATTVADGADDGPRLSHIVESPQDLTGLGITLGEQLTDMAGDDVVVTFDSLTAMLQHVDTRRAFRFLHVLTSRASASDGVGHFHIDPAAHDRETLATIASVFDARARFRDGDWTVVTRD